MELRRALVAAAALCAVAAAKQPQVEYVAPVRGLDVKNQTYQLAVWASLLCVLVMAAVVYFIAGIDYTGDSLLFVDTEADSRADS